MRDGLNDDEYAVGDKEGSSVGFLLGTIVRLRVGGLEGEYVGF
jgi:hypothetical protein